jgi:hypothetical protein
MALVLAREEIEGNLSGDVYCGGRVGSAWKKPWVDEDAVSGWDAILDVRKACFSLVQAWE